MNSFLLILTFFTRIKVNKEIQYSEYEFKKGINKLPLVGIIIGGILFILSYILDYISTHSTVKGIVVFILYILITGAIHIDGFSDTLDGIYSNKDKDEMLKIMKDSRCGVFGALGISILVIMYILIFSIVKNKVIFFMPIVSRVIILLIFSKFKYAVNNGLGKIFMEEDHLKAFIFYLSIIFLLNGLDMEILIAIILSIFITFKKIKDISLKLDGITGDILGFAIEYSQIIFLFMTYISKKLLELIY